MPNRDGKGPYGGSGPRTGRKLGSCRPKTRRSAKSAGSTRRKVKKFLQKAVNPKHKGYCTPMTKKTCTPRRKALAKRLKPGGDLYRGKKK